MASDSASSVPAAMPALMRAAICAANAKFAVESKLSVTGLLALPKIVTDDAIVFASTGPRAFCVPRYRCHADV